MACGCTRDDRGREKEIHVGRSAAGGDPLDGGGVMAVDAVRLMRRLKDADPRERRIAVRALARPAGPRPRDLRPHKAIALAAELGLRAERQGAVARALHLGGRLGASAAGPQPARACLRRASGPTPQPLGQTDQREARSGDPHGDTAPFKKMARGSLYAKPDKACAPAPVV